MFTLGNVYALFFGTGREKYPAKSLKEFRIIDKKSYDTSETDLSVAEFQRRKKLKALQLRRFFIDIPEKSVKDIPTAGEWGLLPDQIIGLRSLDFSNGVQTGRILNPTIKDVSATRLRELSDEISKIPDVLTKIAKNCKDKYGEYLIKDPSIYEKILTAYNPILTKDFFPHLQTSKNETFIYDALVKYMQKDVPFNMIAVMTLHGLLIEGNAYFWTDMLKLSFGESQSSTLDDKASPLDVQSQFELCHKMLETLTTQYSMMMKTVECLAEDLAFVKRNLPQSQYLFCNQDFEETRRLIENDCHLLRLIREEMESDSNNTNNQLRPYNTVCSMEDSILHKLDQIKELENKSEEYDTFLKNLAHEIEDILYQYINSACQNSELTFFLETLPENRRIALVLINMINSFDGILELWDIIFDRYQKFLSSSELSNLSELARATWEPVVYKSWGL